MFKRISLRRINVFRNEDGNKIIVSKRRDMSRGVKAPGVKVFTKQANARARAANRAKDEARKRNKRARASRKRNRA